MSLPFVMGRATGAGLAKQPPSPFPSPLHVWSMVVTVVKHKKNNHRDRGRKDTERGRETTSEGGKEKVQIISLSLSCRAKFKSQKAKTKKCFKAVKNCIMTDGGQSGEGGSAACRDCS